MSATLPPRHLNSTAVERVRERVNEVAPELIAIRRDLHANPELSWLERRTTDVIAEHLESVGIRFRRLPGTGIIADLGAQDPIRRVALRADLDALPLEDRSGVEFASTVDGVAHACGHDVHTTALLGAGVALHNVQGELEASGLGVRLLFQPAEEQVPGGAHHVMEGGGLEGVDQVLALHCDPSIDVGEVGLVVGPITSACDSLTVNLSGRGGHTSRPHLTQDLVYALGKIVTDVPAALTRRLDPRAGAVLVWGQVQAGIADNVIPAVGSASGTLRVLDAAAWRTAADLVEKLVHDVAAPYDVKVELDYRRGVPPVVNDALAVEALRTAAVTAIGPDSVVPTEQSLGGEDFSWYLGEVPGAMARLGTRTPGGATYELHQGDLVIDERAIGYGANLLAGAALAYTSAQ